MTAPRLVVIVSLILAIIAAPLAAVAQPANTVRKLGYVSFTDLPKLDASFNSALRRLGWEEGRNLVVERRNTQSGATLADVAAEVVRLAPDVIVVPNAGIAGIMRRETTTIPIVVMAGSDLVATGLVESLARPGRNVTGTQVVQLDLMGKRLQLLKEILGNPTRVAALWDLVTTPTSPSYWDNTWKQFEEHARQLNMQGWRYEVRDVSELEDRFRAMAAQRVDAVLVFGSPFMFTHARALTALAAKYRIAGSYETRDPFVDAGGLMSYHVDFVEAFARGAVFVDKIFPGAKPAELPVEQPTKFELAINLKTAKALGLTIPPSVLSRADEIIQ